MVSPSHNELNIIFFNLHASLIVDWKNRKYMHSIWGNNDVTADEEKGMYINIYLDLSFYFLHGVFLMLDMNTIVLQSW